jgi:hypothetical protein
MELTQHVRVIDGRWDYGRSTGSLQCQSKKQRARQAREEYSSGHIYALYVPS